MRCLQFRDISEEDLSELFPSKEAITVMSDPKLVPKWWGKGLDLPKDEAVLRSRPVASYGKQHKFGFSILHKEGCVLCWHHLAQAPGFSVHGNKQHVLDFHRRSSCLVHWK